MINTKQLFGSVMLCLVVSLTGCAQRSSPESVVRVYVDSLTGNNLAGFWRYDLTYNNQVREALADLPKAMWAEKTAAIRREWTDRIQKDRSSNQVVGFGSGCWQVFRPGAAVSILEVRAIGGTNPTSSWKAFIKIRFPSQEISPLVFYRSGTRKLQNGTVTVEITKAGPPNPGLRVSSSFAIVPEGTSVWPVPRLGNDQALELAKAAMPEGRQPKVTLQEMWTQLPSFRGEPDAAVVKEILTKYGIELRNTRRQALMILTDMTPPSDWSRYSLRSQFENGISHTALKSYALSQSVDYVVSSLQQPTDVSATAIIHVTYSGCTPICAMLKELNQSRAASKIFLNPVAEWPQSQDVHAFYAWSVDQGWKLSGLR